MKACTVSSKSSCPCRLVHTCHCLRHDRAIVPYTFDEAMQLKAYVIPKNNANTALTTHHVKQTENTPRYLCKPSGSVMYTAYSGVGDEELDINTRFWYLDLIHNLHSLFSYIFLDHCFSFSLFGWWRSARFNRSGADLSHKAMFVWSCLWHLPMLTLVAMQVSCLMLASASSLLNSGSTMKVIKPLAKLCTAFLSL